MALTPSVIPFGPQGGAVVAAPDGATAADGTALPGGFLGMLGALAAPPASPTPSSVLTDLANTATALATAMTTAAANSGTDAQLAAQVVAPASDAPSTDLGTSPEAAAAAMAVMAQMLAGTQAVPLQTAAPTLAPASAPAAAMPTALDGTAPDPAGAQTDPLVLAATATTDTAALAQKTASIPLASLLPRQPGVQSAAIPATSQDGAANQAVDPGKAAGFQALTALLSDAKGPAAVAAPAAPTAPDGSRLVGMNTLAMPAAAGDAATTDAQQPVLIREPVGTAQWADSIGARLTMMATRGEQHGSLRLSPEHLGPVEVQIRTQDDKASVWFGAQHADTRVALQDALPRLRELFAAQGMQLADAGVSREPPRQEPAPTRAPTTGFGGAGDSSGVPELAVALPSAGPDRLGLLDTYA